MPKIKNYKINVFYMEIRHENGHIGQMKTVELSVLIETKKYLKPTA